MVCDVDCRDCASDNAFGVEVDGDTMSLIFGRPDRDEAADDEAIGCTCRACGKAFESPYFDAESYLCDECLSKPREKPKGVFE